MIVVQIICNFIMFVSFIANVAYLVWEFVRFPKVFRQKDQMYQMLPQEEYKKRRRATYEKFFIRVLGISLLFFFIGVATCLLDGLSRTEDDSPYMEFAILVCTIVIVLVFFFILIYSCVMRKRFEICMRNSGESMMEARPHIQMIPYFCMGIAFFFAYNTMMTVYTLAMLIA